jgi:hypothetical protein
MADITYKQTPPRRPTLEDLHGGLLVDDTEYPPDNECPRADGMNQGDALHVAAHNMLDAFELYITFSGAAPVKTALRSLRDDLELTDFTLVDGGTGITEITHTGGLLPADPWPATAYCVGTGDSTAIVEAITNGWRVRTRTGGSLADVAFVLKAKGL